MFVEQFEKAKLQFPINQLLIIIYLRIYHKNYISNVLSLNKPVMNNWLFNRGPKIPNGCQSCHNCDGKNCSCSIINYSKTFNTTINMATPTSCNVWVGLYEKWYFYQWKWYQTWTIQGLFQNVGRRKWQNKNFYNSASNFIDSQHLALNVCFWMW